MLFLPFRSLDFTEGKSQWSKLFKKTWPAYERWFLKEGLKARPGYLTSLKAVEEFLPDLVPIYKDRCEEAGGGDLASRFLSMYCPPPYMSGCSQIAWIKENPLLIRNYDYSPRYFEGVLTKTNWLKPIIGMSDCTWGLLDGVNEDGLCVSLTFGGRRLVGKGFGIPIVIRYCLETCSNVDQAIIKLGKIPVHMAYNVTLLDANSRYATIYFTPGHANRVIYHPVGTNHQEEITWTDYAVMTQTIERKTLLEYSLDNPLETAQSMIERFLAPPLFNTAYEKAFGTLYTAAYSPTTKGVSMIWPSKSLHFNIDQFEEEKTRIVLKTNANRLLSA